MIVKIKKSVLGEEYIFRVEVLPFSYACTFRIQGMEKIHPATISETFEHVVFSEPITLTGYVNDIKANAPKKSINKLKLSRENRNRIKEYFE